MGKCNYSLYFFKLLSIGKIQILYFMVKAEIIETVLAASSIHHEF
jgi:hypothetical protein